MSCITKCSSTVYDVVNADTVILVIILYVDSLHGCATGSNASATVKNEKYASIAWVKSSLTIDKSLASSSIGCSGRGHIGWQGCFQLRKVLNGGALLNGSQDSFMQLMRQLRLIGSF